jgi:site-specific recombinase XerD
VVPLDRACHDADDQHRLNLLPHLEPGWRPQLAHAVSHLGVVGALRRISGPGFHPSGNAFAPPTHPAPEVTDGLPDVLSDTEVLALIAACPNRSAGIRNRALIAVLWCCGLRTSEALTLRAGDVDLDALTVLSRGRTLGLDHHTGVLVEGWLDCRRGLAITADRLFCTLASGPLQPRYLQRMLCRLAGSAGVSRPVTPGLLRSAYAAGLLRDGAPLEVVTVALGHSSRSVTGRHLRRIEAAERKR